MKKKIKDLYRKYFPKKIIDEQKVISIIKKAHRKEQKLYNKLLEQNCDTDYISEKINEPMKNEIVQGIKKHFSSHGVYFAESIITEEDDGNISANENSGQSVNNTMTAETEEKKTKWLFGFGKKKNKEIESSSEETNLITYTGNLPEISQSDTGNEEVMESDEISLFDKEPAQIDRKLVDQPSDAKIAVLDRSFERIEYPGYFQCHSDLPV